MSLSLLQSPPASNDQAKRDELMKRIGPLPEPRIWNVDDLARFFRLSRAWVYSQTEESCEDKPPRVQGTAAVLFDSRGVSFLLWLARRLGIDTSDIDGCGDEQQQ